LKGKTEIERKLLPSGPSQRRERGVEKATEEVMEMEYGSFHRVSVSTENKQKQVRRLPCLKGTLT